MKGLIARADIEGDFTLIEVLVAMTAVTAPGPPAAPIRPQDSAC